MTPTYRVIASPRAVADLEEIHSYIAQDSPASAAKVIERLREAMQSLEALPHRYPIYQGKRRPATAVRRLPVPTYLVFDRVDDHTRVVSVVTVRHGARKPPRRFG